MNATPTAGGPQLLPCPFCGSKVRDTQREAAGHGNAEFVIECHCGCKWHGGPSEDSAVRTWNRRSPTKADERSAAILRSVAILVKAQLGIESGEPGDTFVQSSLRYYRAALSIAEELGLGECAGACDFQVRLDEFTEVDDLQKRLAVAGERVDLLEGVLQMANDLWREPDPTDVVQACWDAIEYALEHRSKPVSHSTLLNKYIEHVEQCEGTDFISSLNEAHTSDVVFNADEVAELKRQQVYVPHEGAPVVTMAPALPEIPRHLNYLVVLVLQHGEKSYAEALYGRDGKFRSDLDEPVMDDVEQWMHMPTRGAQ